MTSVPPTARLDLDDGMFVKTTIAYRLVSAIICIV